jgi:hypothetical protein
LDLFALDLDLFALDSKLLDYLGNAVYVGLFIISIIVVIVLHCLNFIDTEKITWTSISSGLIAIIGLIFAGDISPPPVPIHVRHKLRLCALKFHLILIN